MLAKVGADLPPGAFYEPKWDGFRAIVFRDGDEVEIGSRNTRPMARYFPEVVAAALESLWAARRARASWTRPWSTRPSSGSRA